MDGRALTQGQLGLRAVPKFPDSILPLAAHLHLAVASCSHHHHELLSRGVEQCQKCEQSPPDTPMTHLAAATTPATPQDAQQPTGPPESHSSSFQGTLGSFPCCCLAPIWLGGDAKPSKTPSPPFISIYCNHARKQPLT